MNAVLVTEYDEFAEITVSEDYAATVLGIFESFGIGHDPDAVWVQGRVELRELVDAIKSWKHSAAGTVVYWLGHGVGPAPGRLLHSASTRTRAHDGVLPVALVDDLFRLGTETKLIVLILEACRTDEFVRALKEELRARGHMCPTLVLFSDESVTSPGAVVRVLREVVDDVFGAQPEIHLARIAAEFEIRSSSSEVAFESLNLGDAVLTRSAQLPAGQTLDVHRRLREVVDALPADERDHFVSKAQSGGSGELTWNFEGRDAERRTVGAWLDTQNSPICIVRGDAGQGKSAFLGDIVTRLRPELSEALIRAGLMTRVDSWTDPSRPIMVISINASGLTTRRLMERVSEGIGEPAPEGLDPDESLGRIATRVDMMDQLVLFIVDGIDEMQEPIEGARLIGTVSARCSAKVLVACRDTPNEGRQYFSFAHADLVQAIVEVAPSGQAWEITLRADEGAIDRYIRKRLKTISPGLVIPANLNLRATDFLHARLLVHESAADPEWLDAGLLVDLLQLDLGQLFELMLDRLRLQNPAFIPIFQACALSQGRGLPIADGVWLTVARAVAKTAEGLDPTVLASFLTAVEPYLRIDSEFDQTVYRPAHSLLRAFLLGTLPSVSPYHRILARLCATHVGSSAPNAYYQHAATMHARQSSREGWWEIDRIEPPVWHLLDRRRVVEDAMRDLFGWSTMPSGVEDMVLSHHFNTERGSAGAVEGWSQALRRGNYNEPRQTAAVRPSESARLHWARSVVRQPLFLSLPGHRGRVTDIREARLGPDESGLLVGTVRGGIYLWNLSSGGLVAEFEGLTGAVFSVCSVVDAEHGLVVLGGDSAGRIMAWSAKSRRKLWQQEHDVQTADQSSEKELDRRPVTRVASRVSMAAVYPRDDLSAVVVVSDHHVRVIDVLTGTTVAASPASERRFGSPVAVGDDINGSRTIVIGAADEPGFVQLHLRSTPDGLILDEHGFVELPADVVSIRLMQGSQDTFRLLLASGQVLRLRAGLYPHVEFQEGNGAVALGDVSASPTGLTDVRIDHHPGLLQIRLVGADQSQNRVVASHGGRPSAVRVVDRPGGRALAASGGSDRTVRIWDPYSVRAGKTRTVPLARTVLAVRASAGRTLGVVAGEGGEVRFIDGSTARDIKQWSLGSTVASLSSSTDKPGRSLIAAGTRSGQVHLWRQSNLERPEKLTFSEQFLGELVVDVDASGELVATASSSGSVTLWSQAHQLDLQFATRFQPSEVTNVKVVRPFDDLAVVVVVTPSAVHAFSSSMDGSRRTPSSQTVALKVPQALVSCLYANGRGVGFVSGASDGQVQLLPQLWTPRHGLVVDNRIAPTSLNLRQPVSAIDALLAESGGLIVVAGGAHGTLVKAHDALREPPRIVELGQHVSSVSAQEADVLLAAVQGGVVSIAFGRA